MLCSKALSTNTNNTNTVSRQPVQLATVFGPERQLMQQKAAASECCAVSSGVMSATMYAECCDECYGECCAVSSGVMYAEWVLRCVLSGGWCSGGRASQQVARI